MKTFFSDYKEALSLVYKSDLDGTRGMRTQNADRCVAVMGYEGSGKSNLGLCMFDHWYETLGKKVNPEDLKYFCADGEMFGRAVKDAEYLQMIALDEGALISYSRQGMSQSNVLVNQLLMTIRGEGYYFLIMIPHVLDLDSYIRKNRLSGLIVCTPDRHFAYYSRQRLRKMMPRLNIMARNNEYPEVQKTGIFPNFVSKFPRYDGVFAEEYLKRKKDGMKKMREKIFQQFTKESQTTTSKNKLTELQTRVMELRSQGLTQEQVAKRMKITRETVQGHEARAKKKQILTT